MSKFGCGMIGFAVGMGVGVLSAKAYFENKYSRIAQEEIDNVKEAYGRKYAPIEKETAIQDGIAKAKPVVLKPSIQPEEKKKYAGIIKANRYADPEDFPSEEGDPRVIDPIEFGNMEGYDTISLTFYADGILTDEHLHLMTKDEIEDSVGCESLNHFGEYEEDSVFVRNDKRKIDYEILKEERNYEDAIYNDKED